MSGSRSVYQHFCPAARALEVVGEKWSLLIVRDLLAGPRRFSELRRSLAAITSRWLSLRLRELEAAGVVEREASGQREVWYRLTPAGADLGPVIDALGGWGLQHAWRWPLPGEPLHAEHLLRSVTRAIDLAVELHELDEQTTEVWARVEGEVHVVGVV